jgi:transcriptional regulator with XRE-family HTH domain
VTASYGATVRRARNEWDLTQAQLAEISGIEQSNISAIENGRRQPSAETLHRLLFACGFELVATAGSKELPLAPPDAWFDGDAFAEPVSPVHLPIATRARMLVAALDASEAIVRSR